MENIQKSNIIEIVEKNWLGNFPDHFFFEIALSGGIDSVVLLDVMAKLRKKYPLHLSAVHVDHGLQTQANDWVKFCKKLCENYQIPLRVEKVVVDKTSSLGIEAEAREQRYLALQKTKQPVIVLAHHQNDQIETFLLAMLRGGGLRGMVGMPSQRHLNDKIIWRPMLTVSRKKIENYALENELKYIQDETNSDQYFLRNWVRKSLLPLLESKIPLVAGHLLENIANLQNNLSVVEDVLEDDYKQVVDSYGSIIIGNLLQLTANRQTAVLLKAIKIEKIGVPSKASLLHFLNWLTYKRTATYEWQLTHGQIYVYDQKIWFWSDSNPLNKQLQQRPFNKNDIQWQNLSRGLDPLYLKKPWQVRSVRDEDSIKTEFGQQSVKKILKSNKIPKFIRASWPVIVNEKDECLVIIGIKVDITAQKTAGIVPFIPLLEKYL